MTKYEVKYSTVFKKNLKKMLKQGKDIDKLLEIVEKLANEEELEEKYKNHILFSNKIYKSCKECHIEPDWLLIYQYQEEQIVLLLIATGSHSDLF